MIETKEQLAAALEALASEIRSNDAATVDMTRIEKRIRMGIGANPGVPCASVTRVDFEVGTKVGRLRIVEAAT